MFAPVRAPMRITQRFGENPKYYAKYDLKGHNGLDIGTPTGTLFYGILPGVWHLLSQKNRWGRWIGYGAAWRLYFGTSAEDGQEWTFGHLQNRKGAYDGKNLVANLAMGQTDNTGDSTGPHLHIGLRLVHKGQILNYYNGYSGAIDPLPVMKAQGITFTNG